jgi:thiol:disulfide interchange protein DsbD
MKAAAFAGHAGEPRGARAQGVAFAVGVLATFLVLAGLLIAARAGGAAVGWGFQLQSPRVTGALALVVLAAALNLSGLYEIGASAQGLGGRLASRGGLIGALFTGALAVVVAAPCTAPFMGPALGFALTQSPPVALAVFVALGLGFALPFTTLAFSPALLRRLPRPGPWMDRLRKVLALPMYATAVWLVWVMSAQTDHRGLIAIGVAAILLTVGAVAFGVAQRRAAFGAPAAAVTTGAGLTLAATVALAAAAPYGPPPAAPAGARSLGALAYEAWSPQRVAALQAEGRPVLVDFTAAWCVTCQVNEQTALNTDETARAFQQTRAVLLKADWTNRDAAIARALAAEGRVGVPLYLVYGAGGGAPKVLPQLLTPGVVAQALEAAAIRPPGSAAR